MSAVITRDDRRQVTCSSIHAGRKLQRPIYGGAVCVVAPQA
jgi:hypothetical protein